MESQGSAAPTGRLGLRVIHDDGSAREVPATWEPRPWPHRPLTLAEFGYHGLPRRGLTPEVNAWRRRNWPRVASGLRRILSARALHVPHFYGQLSLSVFRADGEIVDLGLAGVKMVTTAGVRYIADDMNNAAGSADVSLFKFHGIGTGGAAEAVGNTTLTTESTTGYTPDSTRPTGSQASATVANDATYTTVGTITISDVTVAATEHGIFTQAATGGGTLLDRTLFSVVNLAIGDSLQATYVLTLAAGG